MRGSRVKISSMSTSQPTFTPPPGQGSGLDFVVLPLVATVSIFLGTSVGAWAVEKVCDELYEAKNTPCIQELAPQLREKRKRKRENSLIIVQSRVWYDVDQVMVNVVVIADSEEELEQAEPLIPEAHKKALA